MVLKREISCLDKNATYLLQSSSLITSTLCDHILSQDPQYGSDIIAKQLESKTFVRQENKKKSSMDADELSNLLSNR